MPLRYHTNCLEYTSMDVYGIAGWFDYQMKVSIEPPCIVWWENSNWHLQSISLIHKILWSFNMKWHKMFKILCHIKQHGGLPKFWSLVVSRLKIRAPNTNLHDCICSTPDKHSIIPTKISHATYGVIWLYDLLKDLCIPSQLQMAEWWGSSDMVSVVENDAKFYVKCPFVLYLFKDPTRCLPPLGRSQDQKDVSVSHPVHCLIDSQTQIVHGGWSHPCKPPSRACMASLWN